MPSAKPNSSGVFNSVYDIIQKASGNWTSSEMSQIHHSISFDNSSTFKSKNKLMGDELLNYFLRQTLRKKENDIEQLRDNIVTIKSDLSTMDQNLTHPFTTEAEFDLLLKKGKSTSLNMSENSYTDHHVHSKNKLIQNCCDRISIHSEEIENIYLNSHKDKRVDSLQSFTKDLLTISKFSKVKTLAVLHYADNFFNYASSIVSSIEFDRDDEFFATAGVTKKIRIYDYSDVVRDYRNWRDGYITQHQMHSNVSSDTDDETRDDYLEDGVVFDGSSESGSSMDDVNQIYVPRYPAREMTCTSKISCLSWNVSVKSYLLAADYEGCVTLWDASNGCQISLFEEHEKRAWSVDFCDPEPNRLASGGDDSKVKIWSLNKKKSALTIDSKANVCSVKFHPTQSNYISFGSADHHVHYYDLRNPKSALHIFKGHKKAASYVKYLSSNEMVSASTDCTLKLWSLNDSITSQTSSCVRTYSGHMNEKNFVGLSINSGGNFLACGSETNEVFIYHDKLSKPILRHKFGNNIETITGEEMKEEDPSQFVSSISWKRKNPNVLVAANSQGRIKVLELC